MGNLSPHHLLLVREAKNDTEKTLKLRDLKLGEHICHHTERGPHIVSSLSLCISDKKKIMTPEINTEL